MPPSHIRGRVVAEAGPVAARLRTLDHQRIRPAVDGTAGLVRTSDGDPDLAAGIVEPVDHLPLGTAEDERHDRHRRGHEQL